MGHGVAEHPSPAVQVEDDGQGACGSGGFDDAYPHLTHVGGDGHPLLVDVRLAERGGLHRVQNLARGFGTQFLEGRRP